MIKLKNVIKPVPDKYKELAPDRIRYLIRAEKAAVIEAADEEKGIAGILAYTRRRDEVKLLWINVLGSMRGQGIGSALMKEFFHRVEGFKEISADLIVTDEIVYLQSFLMSYRFRFQKDVSYELLKSFDFLEQTPLLNCKAPEAGCDSIEKLDIDEYLKAVSELEKNMQEHIPESEEPDASISSFHRNKKGDIDAMLLIYRCGSDLITPVLLCADKADKRKSVKLLRNSMYLYKKSGKKKDDVYVRCRSSQAGELIDVVFLDVHPIRIMRGICRS